MQYRNLGMGGLGTIGCCMEALIKISLFNVPVDALPVGVPSPGAILADVGVLFISHSIHHLARCCVSVIMISSSGRRGGNLRGREGEREREE